MSLFVPTVPFGLLGFVLCGFAIFLVVRLRGIGRRPAGYPPGPPTLPIIGNIHQMPAKDAHLTFAKWASQYGDVYSLILGCQTIVVLNSDEAVKVLFDRRGNIYSDRPDAYIGQDLCSGGLRTVLMKHGPHWRKARKAGYSLLSRIASQRYTPFQDLENKQMLYDLLNTPEDLLKHLRRYSNAVTTSMLYGWRTPTYEDPALQQLFNGFEKLTAILSRPEVAFFDAFPILRWLPDAFAPVKREAKAMHRKECELYLRHWLHAKQGFLNKTIPPCFSVGLIKAQDREGLNDVEAAYLVGNILEAGSDTTANTLYSFIQAMLLFPEIQLRAREEINRVCGDNRLPGLEDEAYLPYVRCVMKETLRWAPTTTLGGIPHAAKATNIYQDFVIPKGAAVINNTWAINMDPRRAADPRAFNPDRYLNDTFNLFDSMRLKDPGQRDHFTFGAGRRACPGIHIAENTLFLGIARFLWAFEVFPVTKPDGTAILPDPGKLTQGFICRPVEYEAKIVPYNARREALMRAAWEQTEKEMLHPITKQWLVNKVPLD